MDNTNDIGIKKPKVILHFKEENKIILENANRFKLFKQKEKIETTYVCDIYVEYGYTRQENRDLSKLLKDLAWRIIDNDTQAYDVVIVRTPKMDELFHEIIQTFISYGIKYRVIEERETKNVMSIKRGPKNQNKKNRKKGDNVND